MRLLSTLQRDRDPTLAHAQCPGNSAAGESILPHHAPLEFIPVPLLGNFTPHPRRLHANPLGAIPNQPDLVHVSLQDRGRMHMLQQPVEIVEHLASVPFPPLERVVNVDDDLAEMHVLVQRRVEVEPWSAVKNGVEQLVQASDDVVRASVAQGRMVRCSG